MRESVSYCRCPDRHVAGRINLAANSLRGADRIDHANDPNGGRRIVRPDHVGSLRAGEGSDRQAFLQPVVHRSFRRPADCPLLPCVLWDMVLRRKGLPRAPFPEALPYSCHRATASRRKWDRRQFHKIGTTQFDLHITDRLRDILHRWYEARLAERAAAASVPTRSNPPSDGDHQT